MDSYLGSFNSHSYNMTYDESNDSLSAAVNRSKKLLDETIANPNVTSTTSTAASRLFKSSFNTTVIQHASNLNASVNLVEQSLFEIY